jgi:SAM-dependent methyltransferase
MEGLFSMSETAKYRHLTARYCHGNGVDIGSGGDPVVPWAISFDLPREEFATYNAGNIPEHCIHFHGDATQLPFRRNTLDFVYSSHLLEDFADWTPVLTEWVRVLKPGGRLVILIPDKARWNVAVSNGQPPNCAHQHEGFVGELTQHAEKLGTLNVVEDRLTDLFPADYSILFVAIKK